MRIEIVSDNQLKITLQDDDLAERDMKISELTYTSNKTQRLINEIMNMVMDNGEFNKEGSQLIFELVRQGLDTLVVLVTKTGDPMAMTENMMPPCFMKREDLIPTVPRVNTPSLSIFSFATVDDAALACDTLPPNFCGPSQMYKLEQRYYLLISNETLDETTTRDMERGLYEYGEKHMSSMISEGYMAEHGDLLLTDAIPKLKRFL